MNQNLARPAALTPCIGVCSLGDDGLCEGCLRTTAEIGAWGGLSDADRRRIMDQVLPLRLRDRELD